MTRFRLDMKRGELFIEFDDGRRLFVDGLKDKLKGHFVVEAFLIHKRILSL